MSLDFRLYYINDGNKMYVNDESINLTHNLVRMAQEARVYKELWHPDEVDCKYAKDIHDKVDKAIVMMKACPKVFKAHNPSNGWGTYEWMLKALSKISDLCKGYPNSLIESDV